MPHIFYIEDTEQQRQTLHNRLTRTFEGSRISGNTRPFNDSIGEICQVNPDICIIDLYEGDLSNPANRKGPQVCHEIWKHNCRPIIVFTASDDHEDLADLLVNPFFKLIKKGNQDSLEQLVEAISSLVPLIDEITRLESELKAAIQISIQESAKILHSAGISSLALPQATASCARRRLAASFDIESSGDRSKPWFQYIVPPVANCLEFGDILQENGKSWTDSSTFKIVLTPTCDLVAEGQRKPKVKKVLVGACVDARCLLAAWGIKKEASIEQVEMLLTQPQMNGYVCIPALPNLIPDLGLRLRMLSFLEFSEIGINQSTGTAKFRRVASIDSPFREMLSWAFMQINARPAIPDRDTTTWASDLLKSLNPG